MLYFCLHNVCPVVFFLHVSWPKLLSVCLPSRFVLCPVLLGLLHFTSIKTGCLFCHIGLRSLITSLEFLHQVIHRSLHSRLSSRCSGTAFLLLGSLRHAWGVTVRLHNYYIFYRTFFISVALVVKCMHVWLYVMDCPTLINYNSTIAWLV